MYIIDTGVPVGFWQWNVDEDAVAVSSQWEFWSTYFSWEQKENGLFKKLRTFLFPEFGIFSINDLRVRKVWKCNFVKMENIYIKLGSAADVVLLLPRKTLISDIWLYFSDIWEEVTLVCWQ